MTTPKLAPLIIKVEDYKIFAEHSKTLGLQFVQNYDYRVGDCLFDAVSYITFAPQKQIHS